jgi:type IV secretion system protein VirB9
MTQRATLTALPMISLAALISATPPAVSANPAQAVAPSTAPRVRTVVYDPNQVIAVAVARGVLTHIVLIEGDGVSLQPGLGQGSDCRNDSDAWCVNAVGRDVFVKPREGARSTDMAVVTDRRRYAFELQVLPPERARSAEVQLNVSAPSAASAPSAPPIKDPDSSLPFTAPALNPEQLIANRMSLQPQVRNAAYSVAVGTSSEDIVPALVFDDGTQTYFRFPDNRSVPTLFQTALDGSEEMVNARMQDDLLVADRVARRFVLRLGESVVAVINEKFDLDGKPPVNGTTVPGVARVLRADIAATVSPEPIRTAPEAQR